MKEDILQAHLLFLKPEDADSGIHQKRDGLHDPVVFKSPESEISVSPFRGKSGMLQITEGSLVVRGAQKQSGTAVLVKNRQTVLKYQFTLINDADMGGHLVDLGEKMTGDQDCNAECFGKR